MIKTSIIILTKNAGNRFDNTLKMIFSQDVENYEVIIIDSGSNDNTIEIAKRYPSRIYEISPDEFHHSKTRNLGVELAKGIFIVFLTADAIPLNDNWLSNILDNFNDKTGGVIVCKKLRKTVLIANKNL